MRLRVCAPAFLYGQGGIRTHEALTSLPVFKTGAFNRSATCPDTKGLSREVAKWRHAGTAPPLRVFASSPLSHGQGGIRTHDTVAGIPVFETGAFNHSATCPDKQIDAQTQQVTAGTQTLQTQQKGAGRTKQGSCSLPPVHQLCVCCVCASTAASVYSSLFSNTGRVGFEPTKRLPVYTLSRRVPSAARPPAPCRLQASGVAPAGEARQATATARSRRPTPPAAHAGM